MTTRALDLAQLFPTDAPAAGEGVGWSAALRTLWQPFAPLADPTFTGNPKAPTPAPGDNDTSIATTAFVAAALVAGTAGVASWNGRVGAVTLSNADVVTVFPGSAAAPAMNGVAAAGVGLSWSRSDHVHPTDTALLAKAGGTMVGAITLSADPAAAMQPVTLSYFQANSLNANSTLDCGTF
jgi:hypothetical protein